MRILFNAARKFGLSLDRIEEETGIVYSELDNPDTRIGLDRVKKLADMVFRASGDSALGLHLVQRFRPYPYHFIMHIVLNSETVLEGIRQWANYAGIELETNRVDLRTEGGDVVVRYTNASAYRAIWIAEYYLSQVIVNCRMFVSDDINPVEARFIHPAPDYAGEYAKLFRAPVCFRQSENALVLRRRDMQRRILSRNPFLKTVLQRQADSMLKELDGSVDFISRIENVIVMKIPEQPVHLGSVAEAMNMSPATLKRRLKENQVTFSSLLNRTRKNLSEGYLAQGLPLKEIARLTGFSEPSAFQHAFKRWFGISPGEYRKGMP